MDLVDLLRSFGLPTVVLGCFSYAVWRACGWMAENVFKPLVQGHLAFLAKLTIIMEQLDKKDDAILALLEKLGKTEKHP